jgi:hypothetical protein
MAKVASLGRVHQVYMPSLLLMYFLWRILGSRRAMAPSLLLGASSANELAALAEYV